MKLPISTGSVLALSFLMFGGLSQLQAQEADSLDYLIEDAWVFDGTGGDSLQTDVGVRGERIVFIGDFKDQIPVDRKIEARGLYLSPGFIDPHTHHTNRLKSSNARTRAVLRCLTQGVTTIFIGSDGGGPLPLEPMFNTWEEKGIGVNAAAFVPHSTLRREIVGYADVAATPEQLQRMKNLVDMAMQEGAFGISTGLFYTPAFFASTDEVIELSKVVAKYGGIYDTHQRDEGSQNVGVRKSVEEVIEIGEKAGLPVHFSHIKVDGPELWGSSKEIIDIIEAAQARGVQVTANQYPYLASRTSLSAALIPSWARDGGNSAMRRRFKDPETRAKIIQEVKDNIKIRTGKPEGLYLSIPSDDYLNGKNIAEIAGDWKLSPEETVVRILEDKSPQVHSFSMSEDDVLAFMKKPWVMTGSDGGGGHPRAFGTYAKLLSEYALKKHVISLSRAIQRSSGQTAQTFKIKDRGFIKEGYYADLVIFDPNTIKDNADYTKAAQFPSGIPYVFVNGKLSIDQGKYTGELAGKALRFKGE